jgi:nucleotide-binding universal stress UspA family protein
MPALKHLIAATDLSPPARQAAERAARLAHETGARLSLVHVLSQKPLEELRAWLGAPLAEQLREAARRELNELAAQLQAARQAPVMARLVSGAVLDALLQCAEEEAADLLVLGARGAGFLRRMVLGTTAERLLRRTTRPLLVVRQAAHEPYRRAMLALDFSPWSAAVLAQARRVAPHAHWVLFHAYQVPFEEKLRFAGVDIATVDLYRRQALAMATQQVHALAEQAGLKPGQWEPCIVEGEASLRLVEQEQERGCDLVVIGKHGQSAAEDLLLGSTTKHLLAEGTADVLVATRPQPA